MHGGRSLGHPSVSVEVIGLAIELRSYSGVTGDPLKRIPYIKCSWMDSIGEPGSMSATLEGRFDVESLCPPYATILATVEGRRVHHAGYVTHARYNDSSDEWTVSTGGGATILKKRLVLNHALASSWADGYVVVDEENPSGDWPLHITGSYSDIIGQLIYEAIKWGPLPFSTMPWQGGGHVRNYNSYDLATTFDRIREICDLADGPEFRMDPRLEGDRLVFVQRTDEEIIDNHWLWNATIPGSPVMMTDFDKDGDVLCTQAFATGGRDEDKLLVAAHMNGTLASKGYPVMQIADTEHSDVSELGTLQSYVLADVQEGERLPESRGFRVRGDVFAVRPGDWADVITHRGFEQLKVTDVSGSSDSAWLNVQATRRL